MNKKPSVPPTLSAPAPASEPDPAQFVPPKNVKVRPLAINIVDHPDGVELEFLVTPFEQVTVQLPTEAKAQLVQRLSGGVVIAKPGDLPSL